MNKENAYVSNMKDDAMLLPTQMKMLCHYCYQLEGGCPHLNMDERPMFITPNLKEETYIAVNARVKKQ